MAFVHPFDDPDVVAGQGTLGLELLEDVDDLARVIVPVGGGGLVSGVAIAVKSARPSVEVIGVQVEACAALPASLEAGRPGRVRRGADDRGRHRGEAPGRPDARAHRRDWVDDVVLVGEDEVAEAMVTLLEKAKLVVEGAGRGRRGRAALRPGRAPRRRGSTVVVLSGGNVDAGLLATVARRHETEAGRRLVLFTRLPDRPGSLAGLLALVGGPGREPRGGRARPRGRRPPRARDRGAARPRDPRSRPRPARARGAHARGVRRAGRAVALSPGPPARPAPRCDRSAR